MPTGLGTILASTLVGGSQLAWLGGSLLLGHLLRPRVPLLDDSRLVTGTDPLSAWQVVYGAARVGGVLTFMHVGGVYREYLHLIVTLAGHELSSIGTLYLDDEAVPVDGNGDATGRFTGHVHVETNLGKPNQATFTALTAATLPEWNALDGLRFNGRGHYASTAANTTLRPSSIRITVDVRALTAKAGVIAAMAGGDHWKLEWTGSAYKFTDAAGTSVTSTNQAVGQWDQVRVDADGTSLRLYVTSTDAPDYTTPNATQATAYDGGTGSGALTVGSLDGASEYFQGDVDDLRIGNLSGPTTLGTWLFSEGSGTTAGDSTGSLDLTLQPIWSSAHRQRGRAHAWVRLKWNADLFPNGIPNITFDVTGKAVLDPRTALTITSITAGTDKVNITGHGLSDGTRVRMHSPDGSVDSGTAEDTDYWVINAGVNDLELSAEPGGSAVDLQGDGSGTEELWPAAYSNNSALCAADYLMDATYGFGAPLLDLDGTLWAAAANECEEAVALAAGGTEDRYASDGVFRVERAPQDVMEELLGAMAGRVAWVAGKWNLYAGAYLTPTITLTEDDFTAPIHWRRPGAAESFNTVKGVHPDPNNGHQPADYPPVTNATYVSEDGQSTTYDLNLPFTASDPRAQRLAKIALERQRQDIEVEVHCKLTAFRLQPGETVMLTYSRFGWSGKVFEVLDGALTVEGSPPVLGYRMRLRETASGVFTWSAEETAVDLAPNTGLPDPLLVSPPEAVALASGTAYLDERLDGTIFSRLYVSWTQAQDQFVLSGGRIEVQYKKNADANWIPWEFVDGAQTFSYILDVKDGTSYDVRVRAVSVVGGVSPWITVSGHTVVGKTAAPSDVTGFSVQQNGALVTFLWDKVTDLDLAGYRIRYGVVGVPWEAAKPLQNVLRAERVTEATVPPSPETTSGRDPWQFWIKAIDTSGNESATAAGYQLTVTPPYDALFAVEQAPAWKGDYTNYVRHGRNGTLNPRSGAGPDASDLFTSYCPTPPASVDYTAPEIDIGYDDEARVWLESQGKLGPGESGIVDPEEELDYHLAAGAYDGFEAWGAGEVTARYYKGRLTGAPATDGAVELRGMKVVVDLLEHSESGSIVISSNANDGKEVDFAKAYRLTPDRANLVVTPPAGTVQSVHEITTDGFKVQWLDSTTLLPTTGTGSYTVSGV